MMKPREPKWQKQWKIASKHNCFLDSCIRLTCSSFFNHKFSPPGFSKVKVNRHGSCWLFSILHLQLMYPGEGKSFDTATSQIFRDQLIDIIIAQNSLGHLAQSSSSSDCFIRDQSRSLSIESTGKISMSSTKHLVIPYVCVWLYFRVIHTLNVPLFPSCCLSNIPLEPSNFANDWHFHIFWKVAVKPERYPSDSENEQEPITSEVIATLNTLSNTEITTLPEQDRPGATKRHVLRFGFDAGTSSEMDTDSSFDSNRTECKSTSSPIPFTRERIKKRKRSHSSG